MDTTSNQVGMIHRNPRNLYSIYLPFETFAAFLFIVTDLLLNTIMMFDEYHTIEVYYQGESRNEPLSPVSISKMLSHPDIYVSGENSISKIIVLYSPI